MRFLHLSDLHLGIRLMNRDLLEDQKHILRQIEEKVRFFQAGKDRLDAIIIAGDIYDKSTPPADAVDLFDEFITNLHNIDPMMEIFVISGNHDSAIRLNAFRKILDKSHIHMVGNPPMRAQESIEHVTIKDDYGLVTFWLLPYIKPLTVRDITGTYEDGSLMSYEDAMRTLLDKQYINYDAGNVLVSHQFFVPSGSNPDSVERADSEIIKVGNIDAIHTNVLSGFTYCALGHIHNQMPVGDNSVWYCGTPMAYSISEAKHEKGGLIVELDDKEAHVEPLILTPLHQIRMITGTEEEILTDTNGDTEDYVYAVLTQDGDIDTIDRLKMAFPNLMDISSASEEEKIEKEAKKETIQSPIQLCESFFPDITDNEKRLLENIINEIKEKR